MSKSTKKTAKTIKPAKSAAKPKAAKKPVDEKPKRISALDAAATVLKASGQAMRSNEMIAAMADQGLWSSPNGKTPAATLYAAILREINTKKDKARFQKTSKGHFAFNTASTAE